MVQTFRQQQNLCLFPTEEMSLTETTDYNTEGKINLLKTDGGTSVKVRIVSHDMNWSVLQRLPIETL